MLCDKGYSDIMISKTSSSATYMKVLNVRLIRYGWNYGLLKFNEQEKCNTSPQV